MKNMMMEFFVVMFQSSAVMQLIYVGIKICSFGGYFIG